MGGLRLGRAGFGFVRRGCPFPLALSLSPSASASVPERGWLDEGGGGGWWAGLQVTMNKAWRSLCTVLGLRESSGVGPQLRKLYVKHVLALECAYDLEGRRDPVELAAACSNIKGRAKRITKEPPAPGAGSGALTKPLPPSSTLPPEALLPPGSATTLPHSSSSSSYSPVSDHAAQAAPAAAAAADALPPVAARADLQGDPVLIPPLFQVSRKKGPEPGGWRELCQLFQISSSNSAAGQLKRQYDKYLFDFECVHERGNCDPEPIRKALEPKKKKKRPAPSGLSFPPSELFLLLKI